VLDGGDVICVAATSAGRLISATLQPGTRVPAYCMANGRVLLAALPQPEVDAWIATVRSANCHRQLSRQPVVTGPSLKKSIAPLRSFVAEPMRSAACPWPVTRRTSCRAPGPRG
jgi:DNA-binding IclR family transcriptional regulator